jgi:hypothetical protein
MTVYVKPKAADFYTRHMVMYPQHVNRISYSSVKALEFLNGRAWDDIALAYVHGLRPSAIRVTNGEETCDSWPWRVTVYVDAQNLITGIRQEVEVWLPDGVENGHDLSERVRFTDD